MWLIELTHRGLLKTGEGVDRKQARAIRRIKTTISTNKEYYIAQMKGGRTGGIEEHIDPW